MRKFLITLLLTFYPVAAFAALKTETVEYKDGETVLEGYLAYDDSLEIKHPGVLVVHEWKGLGAHAKKSAERLAGLGYVALAVDMYGKGIRPETAEDAGKEAGKYKNDRKLMRQRISAGLETLRKNPFVDQTKLAAIGYCFGGTTVLELARGGSDVDAVVSFHGGLQNPDPDSAKNIKTNVLVLHGEDDPFVKPDEVKAFDDEMKKAGKAYSFVAYPGAVHSFTNPDAGDDPSKGAAYNAEADKQSWEEMQNFLADHLE